jgi:predicted NAD/FAD-binding protein
MPRDLASSERPLRVAVVGSGVSGLGAAWLLAQAHTVTLFEAEGRLGGHSNTVDVPGPSGPVPVDTGFIVYNERNYPNLTALFRHLEVATQPSDMSFGVSINDGALEYAGADLASLFAQKRNLMRPRFWRMLADILRFYRHGPALLGEPGGDRLTLGQFLDREGFSAAFVEDHLMPMAAAIWSTPIDRMRDHPAAAFIRFSINHGLMQVRDRPQWRTVTGGSRAYVARLADSLGDRILADTPVKAVSRLTDGVVVEDGRGNGQIFDHVVLAVHADQALAMLADPTPEERRLLGAFAYARNIAVLHGDAAWMPRRRRAWASWNYLARRGADGHDLCVTYCMNRLQSIDTAVPVFVTLNPWQPPADRLTYRTFTYDHPVYDVHAMAAQPQLRRLQGVNRTWFCGSYFGAGFHEDGLASGLAVAERLGGVRRPWVTTDGDAAGPAAAAADPRR